MSDGNPAGRTPGVSHRKPEKKGGKGPLMIGIVIALLAAIIGINMLTAKQQGGGEPSGSAASGAAEAGSGAGENGSAAEESRAAEEAARQASLEAVEATRPVLSPPPGETGAERREGPGLRPGRREKGEGRRDFMG